MGMVRREVVTPVCRRTVLIDVRDFMMEEQDLAAKYGVPWDNGEHLKKLFLTFVGLGFLSLMMTAFRL